MLDDRKAAVLRAVVEEYIDTAQPVGSAHVRRSAGVTVSSATIRNDMAALEREGYLSHPAHRAPAASRPTRATASSSTRSTRRATSTGPSSKRVTALLRPYARRARADALRDEPAAGHAHELRSGRGVARHRNRRSFARSTSSTWAGYEGLAVIVLSNHVVEKVTFEIPSGRRRPRTSPRPAPRSRPA